MAVATIHFAAFADLALLALAAVGANATVMTETPAAVASVHSLTRIESGRQLHIGSEVETRLPAASGHAAPVGRTAHYSGEAGFG